MQKQLDELTSQKLRYEGRLEEARINQNRMSAQFKQTVDQFTEAERLRRHLLFATNQLRQTRMPPVTVMPGANEQAQARIKKTGTPPGQLDVAVIQAIEPLYVERLHESGIHTVADLAGQTPARVAHFAGLADPDESKEWIAQAKAMINTSPRASA
jgi:predicted flap endonuclease-1-like 5' DNA nuclease